MYSGIPAAWPIRLNFSLKSINDGRSFPMPSRTFVTNSVKASLLTLFWSVISDRSSEELTNDENNLLTEAEQCRCSISGQNS